MFTGIIDHYATVETIEKAQDNILKLGIQHQFNHIQDGESIAIDGVCLTASHHQAHYFEVDVSPETYQTTTLKYFKPKQKVNLERSLTLSDHLGGHIVLGHVDKAANVKAIKPTKDFTLLEISGFAPEEMSMIVSKGSIAINGISLTINKVLPESFEIMIIPHTYKHTNLQFLQINDKVNVEFDYLARLVKKQLQAYIDKEKSHEN